MLNWDPNNIFRLGSKPKLLQIQRNLLENIHNHHPKKSKKIRNVKLSENRCFVQNGFFKNRPHMAAQADPQSGKCSYIDRLSFILSSQTVLLRSKTDLYLMFWSQPQFFMKTHFFIWSHLGFISCRTYSLLRRVRHNSKIESKSDLLNKKCPNILFFMRNDWKWVGP